MKNTNERNAAYRFEHGTPRRFFSLDLSIICFHSVIMTIKS